MSISLEYIYIFNGAVSQVSADFIFLNYIFRFYSANPQDYTFSFFFFLTAIILLVITTGYTKNFTGFLIFIPPLCFNLFTYVRTQFPLNHVSTIDFDLKFVCKKALDIMDHIGYGYEDRLVFWRGSFSCYLYPHRNYESER